jgi:hypothetical protein
LKRAQIALAEDIENRLIETLEPCDKQRYYIFSQVSVRADDLKNERMPRLQGALADIDGAKFMGIPDVVDDGWLKAESVSEKLGKACEARGKKEALCEYTMVEWKQKSCCIDYEQRGQRVLRNIALYTWICQSYPRKARRARRQLEMLVGNLFTDSTNTGTMLTLVRRCDH